MNAQKNAGVHAETQSNWGHLTVVNMVNSKSGISLQNFLKCQVLAWSALVFLFSHCLDQTERQTKLIKKNTWDTWNDNVYDVEVTTVLLPVNCIDLACTPAHKWERERERERERLSQQNLTSKSQFYQSWVWHFVPGIHQTWDSPQTHQTWGPLTLGHIRVYYVSVLKCNTITVPEQCVSLHETRTTMLKWFTFKGLNLPDISVHPVNHAV